MTTTPDPTTVREIAQEVANIALHDAVHVDQWISAVVNSRFGNECSSFRAPLHTAVARRMAVVKPSWPDELPQDGAAPDLWWPFTGGADTCYLSHDDDGGYRECCMRAGLAYALKARDGHEAHTPTVEYGPLDASTRSLIAAATSHVATNKVSADFADDEDGRDGYAVRLLNMLEANPDRFQESEEEDLRAALSALFQCTAEAANLATALDERDTHIAQLERELRELRGTELNPSPLVLDAQAYNELRNEIAATMGDEWDLDEAEISILIKYVRWLAAGQPRDEDGYPIRRKAPKGLGGASGASRCRNLEITTPPQDDGDVSDDLYWPFTGGMDTCFSEHDGEYRECCWRAGLAYVLKLHEQQVRASATDVRAVAEAVARLKRWLNGRQGKVHSVVSTTNVIAEPRDRSTAAWAIAESDARDTKPEA